LKNIFKIRWLPNGKYELQNNKKRKCKKKEDADHGGSCRRFCSPFKYMCAQCSQVPLLACDDPDVTTKVPASSKSWYV
jgi:hypothetical protein